MTSDVTLTDTNKLKNKLFILLFIKLITLKKENKYEILQAISINKE